MSENYLSETISPEKKNQKSPMLSFYKWNFYGEMVFRTLLGFSIITMLYTSKPFNQNILTRLFMGYFVYKIVLNLYFISTFKPQEEKYTKSFLYEIIYFFSLLFFAAGFYFVLKARVPSSFLPIFLIPLIVVCFLRLVIGQFSNLAYIPNPIFHFLESIQILLITLKFVFPESLGRWYLILMIYLVISLALMFVAAILAIVFVVSFFGMLIGLDYFNKDNKGWVLMGLSVPIIAKVFSNFLLLMCFWILADGDLLGINPNADLPDKIVLRTAYVLIGASILTIAVWYIFQQSWGVAPFDFFELMKEDLTNDKVYPRFQKESEEQAKLVEDQQSDQVKINENTNKV